MPALKAIIFDLDGTLIHSAPDLQFAANEALASVGRDPIDLPTTISFIGNGVETLVKRTLVATGGSNETLHKEVLSEFLDVYAKNSTTLTKPYEGVVQALKAFRDTGFKLGICTNKPTTPAKEICESLNLAQYFDVIVGAESDNPKKPDAFALLHCVHLLGCSPKETLYVGDSAVDYQTAQNATIEFRLFTGGYLNDPLSDLAASARFDDWKRHGISIS